MRDAFACLGIERRPLPSETDIKDRYQKLAGVKHPDTGGDMADFTELNASYRCLLDPKERLQHLLELEGIPANLSAQRVPRDCADLVFSVREVLSLADDLLGRVPEEPSMLDRALVAEEVLEIMERLQEVMVTIEDSHSGSLERIHEFDEAWEAGKNFDGIGDLVEILGYQQKCRGQLQERILRMMELA